VSLSEQLPSIQWAALKFRGEKFAEVWFKPDDDPLVLRFRIPQTSFDILDIGRLLTTENLLKAVAIAPEEVESWHYSDVSYSGMEGPNPEMQNPLQQPPPEVPYLEMDVRLRPPNQAVASTESCEPERDSTQWQDVEARWKALLGLEATIDTLRISVEGLRAELESSVKRMLTTEERLHALSIDVVQWNKAKSRIHYALPKTREFVHRATWARGTPERKQLDELFKNVIATPALIPQINTEQVLEDLEILRKDRQILSGQGTAVCQECKGIVAEVQGALRRLQSNAAGRALKKKGASGLKGKSF
jgi:hypothetical protein